MTESTYQFTFHFSSGKSIDILMSQEQNNKLIESLKKGWNEISITDENYGLNFSLITHYTVKKR
jgi:hypothetical protein